MFRTSIVHLQERSYAVCCNLVCLDTSCCYEGDGRASFTFMSACSRTTASRMAPAYSSSDIQPQNVAPDEGLNSPKHVEHFMINKDTL